MSGRTDADTRRGRDSGDPCRGLPFEIIGYDPPGRLTLAGHIGDFEAVADYSLDELALGTMVSCRVQVDLSNPASNGDVRLLASRIEAAVLRSLERAKQLLDKEYAS